MSKNNLSLLAVGIVTGLLLAGCQTTQSPSANLAGNGPAPAAADGKAVPNVNKPYSPAMDDCAGFSSADAEKIIGVPAAQLTLKVEELYAGNWSCYFEGASYDKSISFNVTESKSVQDAMDDMDSYRSNLGLAQQVIPGEDQSTAAYQEVSGVGDEAFYTTVNDSLAARKGNIHLQIMSPDALPLMREVAKTFFSKL